MIERVLEGERSREQIKNKYMKEERKNKAHIDKLLANKARLTLKDFTAKYGPIKISEKASAVKEEEGDYSSSLNMVSSESSSEEDDSCESSSDGASEEMPTAKLVAKPKPKGN